MIMGENSIDSCDVLIIGSGLAGLSLALRLATSNKIIVLSKDVIYEGATRYAQGGIAAVFDEDESIALHIEDTLIAGSGLCNRETVTFVTKNGRHCVQWLINQGMIFDTEIQPDGKTTYHLTREGGHSNRRILHAADATGNAVETTLAKKALNHPNIRVLEHTSAVDLILSSLATSGPQRVVGVWLWNQQQKRLQACRANAIVLATGGASSIYQYTTNPDTACGDGVAIAWRAGCRVANLEFNQFHPTTLYHPQAQHFLLTEALRGEGAHLKRPDGSRFMLDIDPRAELAPRDIVARAIDGEMKRMNINCVYLDISHQPSDFIRHHFPCIYEKLLPLGLDLTVNSIPVVPAAHYTCGGVMVDRYGRTDVNGLYAIGEVSCTGLHGANRLASNSLLECLVYGWSAAEDITRWLQATQSESPQFMRTDVRTETLNAISDKSAFFQQRKQALRCMMWESMGIIRHTLQLEQALRSVTALREEVENDFIHFQLSDALLTLRNLVMVAELMIRCALMRKESRGLHYSLDFPEQAENPIPSILNPVHYIKR